MSRLRKLDHSDEGNIRGSCGVVRRKAGGWGGGGRNCTRGMHIGLEERTLVYVVLCCWLTGLLIYRDLFVLTVSVVKICTEVVNTARIFNMTGHRRSSMLLRIY